MEQDKPTYYVDKVIQKRDLALLRAAREILVMGLSERVLKETNGV